MCRSRGRSRGRNAAFQLVGGTSRHSFTRYSANALQKPRCRLKLQWSRSNHFVPSNLPPKQDKLSAYRTVYRSVRRLLLQRASDINCSPAQLCERRPTICETTSAFETGLARRQSPQPSTEWLRYFHTRTGGTCGVALASPITGTRICIWRSALVSPHSAPKLQTRSKPITLSI
jgi:hypothetical protein